MINYCKALSFTTKSNIKVKKNYFRMEILPLIWFVIWQDTQSHINSVFL